MRNWNRNGIFAAIASFALVGILSCNEEKDRVFDNPGDPSGTNYSPPSVQLLTRSETTGMGDTVRLKAVWHDPESGDRVTKVSWGYLENQSPSRYVSDSSDVSGDTIAWRMVFSNPGICKVSVRVHDDHGVWSQKADTFAVDVHRVRSERVDGRFDGFRRAGGIRSASSCRRAILRGESSATCGCTTERRKRRRIPS